MVNCPLGVLIIMLWFNIVAIFKDWNVNRKIFETYRSKTGNLTIDPINQVPQAEREKGQSSANNIVRRFFLAVVRIQLCI